MLALQIQHLGVIVGVPVLCDESTGSPGLAAAVVVATAGAATGLSALPATAAVAALPGAVAPDGTGNWPSGAGLPHATSNRQGSRRRSGLMLAMTVIP